MATHSVHATSIAVHHAQSIKIECAPDECPICHRNIDPLLITARTEFPSWIGGQELLMEVIYQCPRQTCQHLFIAKFVYRAHASFTEGMLSTAVFRLHSLAPKTFQPHGFEPEIQQISPSFVEFFNQASAAETFGLTDIAGPGYGKALEFLVKDYLISQSQADSDTVATIKKEFLSSVIKYRIPDGNIRKCAERATWLRNDETHYERRWKDKDVSDLKKLIKLTVNLVCAPQMSPQESRFGGRLKLA